MDESGWQRAHQLFIADLHLQAEEPATLALASDFVADATGAGALWILGDLVDHWVGDDDDAGWLQPFCDALQALAASGCAIHLLHGNRDFLMGEQFAARMGATLHRQDSIVIRLGCKPALLMHGDTLCTDDRDYQHLRATLRSPEWQADFLARPLAERRQVARALRNESREASARKAETITDVNEAAVIAAMRAATCDLLVHGHTHRPCSHEVPAVSGRRVVVGDWHADGARIARWDGSGMSLERVSSR